MNRSWTALVDDAAPRRIRVHCVRARKKPLNEQYAPPGACARRPFLRLAGTPPWPSPGTRSRQRHALSPLPAGVPARASASKLPKAPRGKQSATARNPCPPCRASPPTAEIAIGRRPTRSSIIYSTGRVYRYRQIAGRVGGNHERDRRRNRNSVGHGPKTLRLRPAAFRSSRFVRTPAIGVPAAWMCRNA